MENGSLEQLGARRDMKAHPNSAQETSKNSYLNIYLLINKNEINTPFLEVTMEPMPQLYHVASSDSIVSLGQLFQEEEEQPKQPNLFLLKPPPLPEAEADPRSNLEAICEFPKPNIDPEEDEYDFVEDEYDFVENPNEESDEEQVVCQIILEGDDATSSNLTKIAETLSKLGVGSIYLAHTATNGALEIMETSGFIAGTASAAGAGVNLLGLAASLGMVSGAKLLRITGKTAGLMAKGIYRVGKKLTGKKVSPTDGNTIGQLARVATPAVMMYATHANRVTIQAQVIRSLANMNPLTKIFWS